MSSLTVSERVPNDFRSDAPIKRTAVERQVNMQILLLFVLLLIMSLVSTIGHSIRSVCSCCIQILS